MTKFLKDSEEQKQLDLLRSYRNFQVGECIDAKVGQINYFFRKNKLDCAVMGLSGGIDSAIVYKLLIQASLKEDSPLKKIVGFNLPILNVGSTNQYDGEMRVRKFYQNLSDLETQYASLEVVDLTKVATNYIDKSVFDTSDFAIGQLNPIVRTPYLYFQVACLQEKNYKPVVVGTINRDEGAYIGYFGKASDAMVDLQLIMDIHKSEIYKLASVMRVHEDIINNPPTGDVYDNKTDFELIGAHYDAIELYTLMHDYLPIDSIKKELREFSSETIKQFTKIKNLHEKNKHKYEVGKPSHSLIYYFSSFVGD